MTHSTDKNSKGFEFYEAYISVVYGLVATDGLEQLGPVGTADPLRFGIPPALLLFFGVFVIGLHFWFTCVSVDKTSGDLYCALAGDRWKLIFFFVDAMVSTAFAWLVLAMFRGIATGRGLLFWWFLAAAGLSLVYDGYSSILLLICRRRREEHSSAARTHYGTIIKHWFLQDGLFLLGAGSLCVLAKYTSSGFLDVWFVAVAIVVLILDVKFHPGAEAKS